MKSATWKEISRCPDEFDEIYSNVSRKLKLTDPDAAKVTNLGGEILAWRAVLRDSNLLKDFNFSNKPKSIYGEELSADMANLTSKAKDKRLEFGTQ